MKKFIKAIQLWAVLLMMINLIGPGTMVVADGNVTNAHPLLVEMAAEDPGQMVSVIVQKLGDGAGLEARVAQMGGEITKDLHIINAFAAEMSAKMAVELAHNADVRWVSLDAPMERSGKPVRDPNPDPGVELPANIYLDTLGVQQVWDMGYDGNKVGVVVFDSGITKDDDFGKRIKAQTSLNPESSTVNDVYGHGTHVAGIIGGEGKDSAGFYMGVAPGVNLYSVKVSDGIGMAYESDAVAGLQWALDYSSRNNIRVVNMSLNSTVEQSYHTSPLNAAVEILWFNGIVVVASVGNVVDGMSYNPILAAPANDPFIITVGASHEQGTTDPADDAMTSFSAYGTTQDGFVKPDIIAPGKDIYSVLSSQSDWDIEHPDRVALDGEYFRLSGTSMSAPMVAGAAALLLQAEPDLTPDQVKYRLMNATNRSIQDPNGYSYPYLDVYATLTVPTTESSNTGTTASQLLWTGEDPVTWDSVAWNSVAWNSVAWNSVAWNSVAWNSVAWNE